MQHRLRERVNREDARSSVLGVEILCDVIHAG